MASPAEPPITRRVTRSVLALLPPLVALVVQHTLWTLIQPYVWFLFYPAVFVSSWIGGLRAGLTATLASTALVWWFFVPPQHSIVKAPSQLLPAGVFIAMGVLFGVLNDRLRKANQRASEALATSRAANEEISRLYEKTKGLDELKTNFFASVSHELRTPLSLVLGPAERMIASPETTEAARRDLEVIARNARTLLRHVNDLLDVSKLEAGKMALAYADTDLARLARFVAGHFEVLSGEKRIAFRVEAPEALLAHVDPDKVQRILLNLLSNAFKFTPSGGAVRLTLRGTAERVRFEVADGGPGIPADKREAAFERFRQLEGGATRRFGGTGLGLSIARELVLLHQGSIAIDEAPEGGALFVVELPRRAPPDAVVRPEVDVTAAVPAELQLAVEELRARPGAVAPSSGAAESGALVLVVEDNREMSRFLSENLADQYRVAVASDGREGLEKARALEPDLILSDLMMPEMSGDELVRALRGCPELDATPIVLLTAKADDELRVRLLREGAQDYLTKPFAVEELRARVANLVARKLAEETLRRAEATIRGMVSVAADAIVSTDQDQRIVLYNEGAEEIFGWSREEALGQSLDVLLPARYREIHRQHVRDFAAGDARARRMGEARPAIVGLRKNGEEFPAQAAISKLKVGNAWMFTVILRDITEQRRVETEHRFLAEVGAVLATTLEYQATVTSIARLTARQLADWCFVDLVEDDGRVRRVEVASADPARSEVAESLKGFVLDPDRPHLTWAILRSKQPEVVSEVSPEPDGPRRSDDAVDARSVMGVPLIAHGRVLGALLVASSQPERRLGPADLRLLEAVAERAALALDSARLYDQVKRAVQERDDVLGVVAHDLRNPLGTIIMQARLLRRPGPEPERRSEKPAEAIERAASRMNRLIQDLLDVTRMEAGRLSIEQAPVPAGPVVSDSVEAQRSLAASASLELRIDMPDDVPAVWADRDRLLQVFENLIGNAIKFTKPGGCITVGAASRDGAIEFRVSDTGAGIASEDLPHVFDRFWQARQAGHRGAGLGLPIVKGIVEAHGGRVRVESSPGRGSTFFFTIPTPPRDQRRQAPGSANPMDTTSQSSSSSSSSSCSAGPGASAPGAGVAGAAGALAAISTRSHPGRW
jgi:PAS domain S-box-containing protein